MSNDELTKLAILGFIASLQPAQKEQVEQCIREVRDVLSKHEPSWRNLAIALIGAEMQLEAD